MDKSYSVEIIDGITTTIFFKKADILELKAAMDEALSTGECRLRLWELKEGITLSEREMKIIAEYGRKILPTPSKGAIVATDDSSYEIMKKVDVYREQEQHETRVFRSKHDAIKWLEESD
ncbi:hypothetical protein ACFL2O_10420 [Thermodesulfobacteriota bacterium]